MQVGYVLLQIILLGQGGTRNPKVLCTAFKMINTVQSIKNIRELCTTAVQPKKLNYSAPTTS